MFLYFDLGNVVARFDHLHGCRQVAEAAGIAPEQVLAAIYDSGLGRRFELGEVSSDAFHAEFCRATGTHPEVAAFFRLERHFCPEPVVDSRHRGLGSGRLSVGNPVEHV